MSATLDTTLYPIADRDEPVRDRSGYAIFSDGPLGRAHALAHAAVDRGDLQGGYLELQRWLTANGGEGPRWVHIQWHMMVFELAVGQRQRALARFLRAIHPACGPHGSAPVDGPSALWRLKLAMPDEPLPWKKVRDGAVWGLLRRGDPYQILHDLLALAGAGDRNVLEVWLWSRQARNHTTLLGFGRACLAIVEEDWGTAASELGAVMPRIRELGGSAAQNELFSAIYEDCCRRALSQMPRDEEWTMDLA